MRKALLVLAVLALGLAGCSKANDKVGSSSNSTPTASGATGAIHGNAENSDFCKFARDYQDQSEEISNAFKNINYQNPEQAKQQLKDAYAKIAPKFKDLMAKAVAIAPNDIKADLTLLGGALTNFLDSMASNGYDFMKLAQDPAFAKAFQDPKFIAAANHVGQYGQSACGIPFTPEPAASAS